MRLVIRPSDVMVGSDAERNRIPDLAAIPIDTAIASGRPIPTQAAQRDERRLSLCPCGRKGSIFKQKPRQESVRQNL